MRLLAIINEPRERAHDDIYRALVYLEKKAYITAYKTYSFLAKLLSGESEDKINHEIIDLAQEFQPDMIIFMHTMTLRINERTMYCLKKLPSSPILSYWEGDFYQPPSKPLPSQILEIIKHCNVVFCQGFGYMTKKFRKICQTVLYVPAFSDMERFHKDSSRDPNKIKYDVVMIANISQRRIPWKNLPGFYWRRRLVDLFYNKLGSRFAVFGQGWTGSYAQGMIPYERQASVYHSSRLALGINNFHGEYYFSDRLPNAMLSGVPIVYSYEYGYEEIFPDDFLNCFFKSPEEAWDIAYRLLSKPQMELDLLGQKMSAFAMEHLSVYRIFEYIVEVGNDLKKSRAIRFPNPWIKFNKTIGYPESMPEE